MDDSNPPQEQLVKPIPTPRSALAAILISACVALIFVSAWRFNPGFNYVGVAFFISAILFVVGATIVRRPLGFLVNEQNVMSLARFQMAGWTVTVLAAYFTYAIIRLKSGIDDPLNIEIDWHLWALLGISTTSLVGTVLIGGIKREKDPDANVVTKTANLTAEQHSTVEDNRQGTLYANTNASDARFTDLFQGDELGNTTHVDLAKVQMFLFSVIALFAFAAMIISQLKHLPMAADTPANKELLEAALKRLPLLPEGLVAILGISHAGYLTVASADHTKEKKT